VFPTTDAFKVPLLHTDSYSDSRARVFLAEVFGVTTASDADITDAITNYHQRLSSGLGADSDTPLWIATHIQWLLQHPAESPKEASRWLLLPAAVASSLSFVYLAPGLTYFAALDKYSALIDVDYPVVSLPRVTASVREFLQQAGVNLFPRLVQFDGALLRSAELAALWKVMPQVELLSLLFREWPHYRQSGEVLALVKVRTLSLSPLLPPRRRRHTLQHHCS
jgi:hypothetical protein